MAVGERMFSRFLVLLVAIPLVELLLLAEVSGIIGPLRTLALILVTGALGVWWVRFRELRVLRVMGQVFEGMREGRVPREIVLDDFLVLLAAGGLISPGILGDLFGLLLLIPFCRNWTRRRLVLFLEERLRLRGREPEKKPRVKRKGEIIIDAEVLPPAQASRTTKPSDRGTRNSAS